MKSGKMGPIAIVVCIFGVGCADTNGPTTRPLTARERQDAAMRDPFGYGPKPDGSSSDIPSITGGGIGEFDRKSFDRDLGKVLGN